MIAMRHLILAVLVLAAGCCGFDREWKRAGVEPKVAEGLAGRWQGAWVSEKNGHHGKLRCLVTPGTNNVYQARFHAKYWKIFSFGYEVPLEAQCGSGTCRFEGQADLGALAGGVYRYKGEVAGTNWQSSYTSRYDRGSFRMDRVR